jgi:hypothetical protein
MLESQLDSAFCNYDTHTNARWHTNENKNLQLIIAGNKLQLRWMTWIVLITQIGVPYPNFGRDAQQLL